METQNHNSEQPCSSPLSPEELSEARLKNIEAVKQLLTPEEWTAVKEAAYAEAASTKQVTAEAETRKELSQIKASFGRLYGHFNNVMLKWGIPALSSYGKEVSTRVPFAVEPDPNAPKPKDRTFYQFDPKQQELVPIEKTNVIPSEPPPPAPNPFTSAKAAEPPPKRQRAPTKFKPKDVPAEEELVWRRELMEKQLKLRPSTLAEVMARLEADGFPVDFPYYSEIVRGKAPRIRTLVAADLYLLVYNKAVKREGSRYSWIADRPNRYKSYRKNKN